MINCIYYISSSLNKNMYALISKLLLNKVFYYITLLLLHACYIPSLNPGSQKNPFLAALLSFSTYESLTSTKTSRNSVLLRNHLF